MTMTKQETYAYLAAHGVPYEATEHRAVFHMGDEAGVDLPHPEAMSKNLFVRDDRHETFLMVTAKGEARVDLKDLRRQLGLRRLTFASEDELAEHTGLHPGSVTPLGLLTPLSHGVIWCLDAAFRGALIGVHPCDNTATVWLQADDLERLVRDAGHEVVVFRSAAQ